jgi:type I restriction enzyme, S subunit
MIADLKPYPKMNDSGVPWLGEVPEHWQTRRAKWLFQTRKELNQGAGCTNVLSLTLRGVVNNDPANPEGLVPKDYATYQLFSKDNLVFKLIDLENLRTSRVGLVHEDGIMSSAYVRLLPRAPLVIRYFHRQFLDLWQRHVFNQLGAGVRSTLGAEDLLNLRVVLPTDAEQTAIVRFIDYVDRRIRRYIRAKRKLIRLLEEQKQAIIHQAVTGQIDVRTGRSYPAYKASGIEWLGQVPEHWEVRRLAHACSLIVDGTHFSPPNHLTGEYLYITARNIKEDGVVTSNATYISEADHQLIYRRCPVRKGDVLYVKDGATAGVATVNDIEGEFSMLSSVALLRPKPALVTPDYLKLVLNDAVFKSHALRVVVGGAMTRFTIELIKRFMLVVPPKAEQYEITKSIYAKTAPLRTAMVRANREIELLNEYRTRLIADVVTGKLDVREAAASLPDDTDETELDVDDEGPGDVETSEEEAPEINEEEE